MKLTVEKLNDVFAACMFTDEEVKDLKPGELPQDCVVVMAVLHNFGFNEHRLEKHYTEIEELLNELPANFKEEIGGGWSFLNGCVDKDGHQWGEQSDLNKLIALGLAIGRVEITPRGLWHNLPGSMPYVRILKPVEEHTPPKIIVPE